MITTSQFREDQKKKKQNVRTADNQIRTTSQLRAYNAQYHPEKTMPLVSKSQAAVFSYHAKEQGEKLQAQYEEALKQAPLYTYDEVKKMRTMLNPQSEKYKFLDGYVGYNSLQDFDRAIADEEARIKKQKEEQRKHEPITTRYGATHYANTGEVKNTPDAPDASRMRDPNTYKKQEKSYLDKLKEARSAFAEKTARKATRAENAGEFGKQAEPYYEVLDNMLVRAAQNTNGDTDKMNAWVKKQEKNMQALSNENVRGLMEMCYKYDQQLAYHASVPNQYRTDFVTTDEYVKAKGTLKKLGFTGKKYNELYDTFERLQNAINAKENREAVESDMNAGGVVGVLAGIGHNTASVLANLMAPLGNLEGIGKTIEGTVKGEYTPIDVNSPLYAFSDYAGTVRGITSQKIEDGIKNELLSKGLNLLYQGGMSSIDSFVNATLYGSAGIFMMGAGAAAASQKATFERTGSNANAITMGILAGAIEVATEKMGFDNLLDTMNNTGKAALRSRIANVLVQSGIEGAEEVASDVANLFADQLVNGGQSEFNLNVKKYMEEGLSKEEAESKASKEFLVGVLESFATGAISGGLSAGTSAIFGRGFSKNEQKVINAEFDSRVAEAERNGKQLSNKEKTKIREQVMRDMQSGQISVESLEKYLGEDNYKKYQEATALKEQEANLEQEVRDLMRKKNKTQEEIDRAADAKAELKKIREKLKGVDLDALKKTLSDDVAGKVKKEGRFLQESYYEQGRKSVAFQADLSEYDEKQRATVQKAMDSGILNNTRLAHQFVNLIAKISGDKGIDFDFTNNEKLKESGLSLQGKTINGYVEGSTVTLNVNSAQVLDMVVGHEVTHILEGTELYDALQETVFEYAKAKGEYSSKLEEVMSLYENMDADPKKELAANLIGEYLFSDEDFVRNLSATKPNLFQKIFNEIKYFCKIVTAGTEEGRKLEELKKTFEDAYREGIKVSEEKSNNSRMKYSISTTESGVKYVDVDTDQMLFDGLDKNNKREMAKLVIQEYFPPGTLIDFEGEEFYTSKRTAKEYAYAEKNRGKKRTQQDKMRASTELDNLLKVSNYIGTVSYEDVKPKHPEAINGISLYKTFFKVQDRWYKGIINVINRAEGKEIYDLTKIRSVSANEVLNNENGLATQANTSDISISNQSENGKKNFPIAPIGENTKRKKGLDYSLSNNITPSTENIYSLATEDSEGRTLSKEQREYFKEAKTVDENGKLKPFYHGTARADRVGTIFREDRATSGPMAYFTDNKNIADNYARDKQDTSLAYEDSYHDYYTQFRIEVGGKNMSISEAWNMLPLSKKNEIRQKAPHVTMDWDTMEIKYDQNEEYGLGNFDQYTINSHRGNILAALTQSWLEDGNLYGEESRFLDVLKMVGLNDVQYMDPNYREEKTYQVYLNITNPFSTTDISEDMLQQLERAAKEAGYEESNNADMWDKKNQNPEEWIEKLKDDIENGTTHVWTSIPDFVTDILKKNGYDGIFDLGGKGGGIGHTVAIPFYSEQIKNIDNQNPTTNKDINFSISNTSKPIGPVRGIKGSDIALTPIRAEAVDTLDKVDRVALNSFVEDVMKNKGQTGRKYNQHRFARVPGKIVDAIYKATGGRIDVKGKMFAFEGGKLFHEIQEHSNDKNEALQGQKAYSEKDIEKILATMMEPDIVEDVSSGDKLDNRNAVAFAKNVDGEMIVVTAIGGKRNPNVVPELILWFSKKKWDNLMQSNKSIAEVIYSGENKRVISGDSAEKAKKNRVTVVHDDSVESPAYTPEALPRSPLGDSISQNSENTTISEANQKKQRLYGRVNAIIEESDKKLAIKEQELEAHKRNEEQSLEDFNREIADLEEQYNSKQNKNTKMANELLSRIERKKSQRDSVQETYRARVERTQEQIEKMKSSKYKRAVVRKAAHEIYLEEIRSLIGDTSTWKDKKTGLLYQINTLRRNLRDIVRDSSGNQDIAKADEIHAYLAGSYDQNEALLKRESRRIKKTFADMNINKYESCYIQMLGEYRHNPDTTLTPEAVQEYLELHQNEIDEAKVDKAIEEARKLYDGLLARLNEALRMQGMKEIAYREGYFPHFTNTQQSVFAKVFNWKGASDDVIPTDIAGLTESFTPNRTYQSFNKHRESDVTEYNFLKGLDNYVHGALDWIYHLEDIQKCRLFEQEIRYRHSDAGVRERIDEIRNNDQYDADDVQEMIDGILKEKNNPLNNFIIDFRNWTNNLAGKKSMADREMEYTFNRKIYSTMTNISNRVSGNMIMGNVSSALTNFIPITQSWGYVSPMQSLRAVKEVIQNAVKDDGMIERSTFMTNRLLEEENLYKTGWDKAIEKGGALMDFVDGVATQVVWRSLYNDALQKGMTIEEALADADRKAEGIMAGRSRGNMPTLFNSKNMAIKALTAFQLEVNNQYAYMFKDLPIDRKKEGLGKLLAGYLTMFIGAYLYNAITSKITGRDSAFDPIGILEDVLRDIGVFGEEDEVKSEQVLPRLAKNVMEEVPFVGGLFGGGRIPISSAIPYGDPISMVKDGYTDIAKGDWKSVLSELKKPAAGLILPGGGNQIKKTVEGLSMFAKEVPGSYTAKGNLRFPVENTPLNVAQAVVFGQWANENAQKYIDKGYAPLDEKKTKEFAEKKIPIAEYWLYRNGYTSTVFKDYKTYKGIAEELKSIKSDKDKNGKTISGSRKENVIKYLNSRDDLDYGQRIIMLRKEYPTDGTYGYDIVDYLNQMKGLSREHEIRILEELGFEVDKDGTVRW